MNEAKLEQAIQRKGLTAPRLTPSDIDALIRQARYHVFAGTTVTVCCITLANGFTVVGDSACASPENFDEEIGREIAFNNARDNIWALAGYALRENLADTEATNV